MRTPGQMSGTGRLNAVWLAFVFLIGCGPSAHWSAMMDACPEGKGAEPALSEPCAQQIGDDLGVEWDQFPAVTFPVQLTGTTLERALVGLWLVGTTELGTVEDVLDDPRVPPSFAKELSSISAALEIPGDTDARRLIYEYVANAVGSVESIPGWRSIQLAAWNDTLYIPEKMEAFDHIYWTRVLVHESGHHTADRSHAQCPEGEGRGGESDDDTWDSATGMEAWYLARVRDRLEDPDQLDDITLKLDGVLSHLCASTVVIPDGVR